MKTYFYFFKNSEIIYSIAKQFETEDAAFQYQFSSECDDDHENNVTYIGFNDKQTVPGTNISLLDANKAIKAFKFSFNPYGPYGLGYILDLFKNEKSANDRNFYATAYALQGAQESGYFDIENAEAQLEALRYYGAEFDFEIALDLCNKLFELLSNGIYEIEETLE